MGQQNNSKDHVQWTTQLKSKPPSFEHFLLPLHRLGSFNYFHIYVDATWPTPSTQTLLQTKYTPSLQQYNLPYTTETAQE